MEENLNTLLDKEADELINAQKYERSADHQGYRSGHYKRNFQTTAGEVELHVPKLKGVPFETTIIERPSREIKRRTKAIGAFPDGQSALMLACARLRHVVGAQ